ncbi:hypothetical protein KVR01_001990 [Diaporthe batatas]|uniref:uncharacterized protein n=1 Tax=Diaporthe batatas TaxID=748121 RepID=UPI001D039D61|nr:uncharacterized protein KVR01_001990 [Diaporthe batatas]KAG8169241.1 hypothetical protein KVR01_001990 [Diaporthe batatas]
MFMFQFVLALLAWSPLIALAAPHSSQAVGGTGIAPKNLTRELVPASTVYSGPWSSFPAMSTWTTFDNMFNTNQKSMFVAGSTQQDVDHIRIAVTSVAASYGIDRRVLLGIIMEESHGGVGVATTYNADGLPTGGLMQASGCHGYEGQNNLAQADITFMIDCGTQHFKTNLGNWGGQNLEQSIYPALREFNSGSVVAWDLSTAPNGVGNPTYVSDIAQRLQGWTN